MEKIDGPGKRNKPHLHQRHPCFSPNEPTTDTYCGWKKPRTTKDTLPEWFPCKYQQTNDVPCFRSGAKWISQPSTAMAPTQPSIKAVGVVPFAFAAASAAASAAFLAAITPLIEKRSVASLSLPRGPAARPPAALGSGRNRGRSDVFFCFSPPELRGLKVTFGGGLSRVSPKGGTTKRSLQLLFTLDFFCWVL